MVLDVIEVAKGIPNLEKAVRYFIGNKVVANDFEQATDFKKQGVKDVITLNGTSFKEGMVSGGIQKGLFDVKLGSVQKDAEISKLVNRVGVLEKKLKEAREGDQ